MSNISRVGLLATSFLLTACSVKPVVLSEQDHITRVTQDRNQLFVDQEPLTSPLTLHQAMARAIHYNLDHRLKIMEEALASDMLEVARLDMLPQLTANAGYRGRNNDLASSSRSLRTGTESLEVSSSQEKDRQVANLGLSWNMLDFGVSYYRATQQADRLMIVAERRRKVVQNIIQDVRSAYWRALVAQEVLSDLQPLMNKIEKALTSARKIENQGLKTPVETLLYQQRLLTSLQELNGIRKELVSAKVELATMMSLPMSTEFRLQGSERLLPEVPKNISTLEEVALLKRPELREEGYHDRISAVEIKRTMASLMPSLNLGVTWNYDSNQYTENNRWFDFSAMVSGNLMDIFTFNDRMGVAKAQAQVVDTRRLALNMAVLSQVHISLLDFAETRNIYQTNKALNDVENRLLDYFSASAVSQAGSELDVIERQMNAVVAELAEGESYASLQTAYGRIFLSVGADPLPEFIETHDIDALAEALARNEAKWREVAK